MIRTLLQIGEAIAVKAGLPIQVNLIGSSDRTAKLILQAIKDGTSKDAFRDYDWMFLQRESSFTTAGVEYYSMPSDFDRFINNTIWDRTNDRPVLGPVGPTKWQEYESGLTGLTGLQRICRLAGPAIDNIADIDRPVLRRVRIYPDDRDSYAGGATDPIEIAYEYISNKVIQASSGGALLAQYKDDWTSDTDVSLIDPDVIESAALYRLLRSLGMSYSDEQEEYNGLVAERGANDSGAETLSMARRTQTFNVNIPETGYGS